MVRLPAVITLKTSVTVNKTLLALDFVRNVEIEKNMSDKKSSVILEAMGYGEVDAECRMILLALLLPKPQGDE